MNHMSLGKPAHILLVDDDPIDVRLTLESLQEGKIYLLCDVVRDGVEAMAFLRRQGEHVGAPRPDLILLDLNMPRKDGREVLADMRADPALRRIPVVILTTSQADEDVLSTYNLGANCYITKPVDLEQFTKVVLSIEDFWFTIVRLPKTEEA
jgi:two-component system, chemotaxis family, response regulator Rcp1